MRTNSSATIYNAYADPETRKPAYRRFVLTNVEWQNSKGSNVRATGGQIAADQATVFIPMSGRTDYAEPKAWQQLPDKSGRWTVQVGDILVRGIVDDEISGVFTVTMLKAKYDNVLVVSSVDSMDSGSVNIRHLEVGAK